MLELLKKQRIRSRVSHKILKAKKGLFSSLLKRSRLKYLVQNPFVFIVSGLCSICITAFVFSLSIQQLPQPSFSTEATPLPESDLAQAALERAYTELGAGTQSLLNRKTDIEYIIQEGDSLYALSKLYAISVDDLQQYNEIRNPLRIPVGTKIIIPSLENLKAFKDEEAKKLAERRKNQPAPLPPPATILPDQIQLGFTPAKDNGLFTIRLFVQTKLPEEGVYYYWDLGDGTILQKANPEYTYLKAGSYVVNLTLKDKYGYEKKAQPLDIEVLEQEGSKVVRTNYLTLNAVGEVFALPSRIAQMEDYLGNPEPPVVFVEERDGHFFYRALRSGYFYLIARGHEAVDKIYLFVSPLPSVHVDRFDLDWYRTQFGTGYSNCGPATVSMAISWAKAENVPISVIRSYLGWRGNGGTSFYQLLKALNWKGIKAELTDISSSEDIFRIIDEGKIAIILFHTSRLALTQGKPEVNLFGRYYHDAVGHYVVIKGYSTDKKYFIVYDPIPSDWYNNAKRYGDGVSMLGRNRYYAVSEINQALSLPKILVISR